MKLKANNMSYKGRKVSILGTEVADISQKEAVDAIISMAKDPKTSHQVVTVNAEMIMLSRRNKLFNTILKDADLKIADSQWVVWAKLIFGGSEKNRVAGVDLVEKLCEKCAVSAIRVGFLGGFGQVAEVVAGRQISKNPGLEVVFAGPGDPTIGLDLRLRKQISRVGHIGILYVGYGMGQQEFWIRRNKNALDVGVFIGVGGALDYLSGAKRRAPVLMQKVGFEWFWRLLHQPYRAKRMIRVFPLFWILVFWQLLTQSVKGQKKS